MQGGEIKGQDITIKLNDKKLFFISAKNAYAAKSIKNNIADKTERHIFKRAIPVDEEDIFYKQNQCATSDFSTKELIEKCDKALEESEQKEKDEDIVWISSGLYALENEILQYAEKFASSVRAFAIIDSMDKVLNSLGEEAKFLQGDNQKSIKEIESEIEKFKEIISSEIKYKKSEMLQKRDEDKHDKRIAKDLGITSEKFQQEVVNPVKQRVNEKFPGWFLGHGKIKVKDGDNIKIKETINPLITLFYDSCILKSNKLIEKNKINFIEYIKDVIRRNGDISEELKKFILNIPISKININDFTNWDKIYEDNTYTDRVWFFETMSLDKEGLLEDIEDELSIKFESLFNLVIEYYAKTMEDVIKDVEKLITNNLYDYSVKLKAMSESKEEMELLGEEIYRIVGELGRCKEEMDEIIWGGTRNV